jgi:hypothetical protein
MRLPMHELADLCASTVCRRVPFSGRTWKDGAPGCPYRFAGRVRCCDALMVWGTHTEVAEPAFPAGGGGAGGEGLGRWRGGFTSKLHVSGRPLLPAVPGRHARAAGGLQPVQTVLAKIRILRVGACRPRTKPESIVADKG